MRFSTASLLSFLAVAALLNGAVAKKPSRTSAANRATRPSTSTSSRKSKAPPVSRRRPSPEFDDEDEEDEFLEAEYPMDEEEEDDYEEDITPRPKRRPSAGTTSNSRPSKPPPGRRPPQSRRRDDYDYEEEYEPRRRGPPPSSRSRGPPPRGGRREVVPYNQPSTFTRGLAALRQNLPDPAALREAAVTSLSAARDTTSRLSSNIYRDIKGLTSSELEQVMLRATRPDDTPVKGKHTERLIGVTYQISGRYDIYDAVLRKLWSKMSEKDWRTTIKALYILHRFSADGAPEHQASLKARLRELRRTRDPKRKDKYFNSKQMLAGETTPENMKFRAFMTRYAHYVLLRAQCFGGVFVEISTEPKLSKKSKSKPLTSTCLRMEHLEAAQMVLKAGMACMLKDGEECENTAIAAERVVADLMGLSAAVATALNRVLKTDDDGDDDAALVKKWCTFYSEELLPETRSMIKKTSPKLDAFGLFLPSRIGTIVSPELLQKGLKPTTADPMEESSTVDVEEKTTAREVEAEEDEEDKPEGEKDLQQAEKEVVEEAEEEEDDEWDYDEEEYYDDEEE